MRKERKKNQTQHFILLLQTCFVESIFVVNIWEICFINFQKNCEASKVAYPKIYNFFKRLQSRVQNYMLLL